MVLSVLSAARLAVGLLLGWGGGALTSLVTHVTRRIPLSLRAVQTSANLSSRQIRIASCIGRADRGKERTPPPRPAERYILSMGWIVLVDSDSSLYTCKTCHLRRSRRSHTKSCWQLNISPRLDGTQSKAEKKTLEPADFG